MPLLHLKLHPILSFFPFAIQFQFYRICAGQFVAGCHKPNQMILASAGRPGFLGYILVRGFYTDDAELICRIIVNCPIISSSMDQIIFLLSHAVLVSIFTLNLRDSETVTYCS